MKAVVIKVGPARTKKSKFCLFVAIVFIVKKFPVPGNFFANGESIVA